MNKFMNFWNTIVKLWKDKRTRSAIILGAYLIFIIIVIVFIRVNSDLVNDSSLDSNTENYSNELEENNNLMYYNDYKYDIIVTKPTGEIYKISNNNEEDIKNYYSYNNNLKEYEIVKDINQDIINLELDLEYILYLINNTEPEYTTKYKDGTLLNNYFISLNNTEVELSIKYSEDNFILNMNTEIYNIDYEIIFTT